MADAGRRYRFSAWVRASASAGACRLQVREWSGGVQQGPTTFSPYVALGSTWKLITADRTALTEGSALDLQDGGQLVRVELPRSALARFGLPMNMDRADERIKADVLVGADGLARAIRFVNVKALNKN